MEIRRSKSWWLAKADAEGDYPIGAGRSDCPDSGRKGRMKRLLCSVFGHRWDGFWHSDAYGTHYLLYCGRCSYPLGGVRE